MCRCAILIVIAIGLPVWCATSPARANDPGEPARPANGGVLSQTDRQMPEGLSASDWSGIREAYETGRDAALAVDTGFQARNPGQGWSTRFDGRGFVTTPDDGAWSWGLELVSYGRGDAQRAVVRARCAEARGGRVG